MKILVGGFVLGLVLLVIVLLMNGPVPAPDAASPPSHGPVMLGDARVDGMSIRELVATVNGMERRVKALENNR